MWLSTNFREPDVLGRQLKKEVKQLAQDLKEHKIPYMLSLPWNDELEPLEERLQRLDGLSIEEYVHLRQTAKGIGGFVSEYARVIETKEKV